MQRVSLPFSLKFLNAGGKAAGFFGLKTVSLQPGKLMARAQQSTGLQDFGPKDFQTGLDILCDSLEGEANLTSFGRLMAQRELIQLLENRLQLIHAFSANREISGSPVKRPVFLLGMPNSGANTLHEVMAQDLNNRTPNHWETRYPFPPPRTETYYNDPRIHRSNKDLKQFYKMLPELQRISPMTAQTPQECLSITALNFTSMKFNASYRVPSYQKWLTTEADFRSAYDLHYQFLQYLQWRHKLTRWILMSPSHLWNIDKLVERYPDAMLVQTHRDPIKITSELSNQIAALRSICSDTIDLRDIAREQSRLVNQGLSRNIELRRASPVINDRTLDILYTEIAKNPITVVKRIYSHFHLDLREEYLKRMQNYLLQNPVRKFSPYRHNFMATGLRIEEERPRFKYYQDRFTVPQEKV